jgi:hypothetical protein
MGYIITVYKAVYPHGVMDRGAVFVPKGSVGTVYKKRNCVTIFLYIIPSSIGGFFQEVAAVDRFVCTIPLP